MTINGFKTCLTLKQYVRRILKKNLMMRKMQKMKRLQSKSIPVVAILGQETRYRI